MSKLRRVIDYERRLSDAEVHRLDAAIGYEHELSLLKASETHLAVDKAAGALAIRLETIERDVATIRAADYMTTDAFEREHGLLADRLDATIARLEAKLGIEEAVSTRQAAQGDLLAQTRMNQRWLIGISVTSGLALLALILHLAGAY